MIDLKSLWIGDELIIKSSGRVGRFAGINQEGKARVDVEGKIFLASPQNIELYKSEVDYFSKIDKLLGLKSEPESKGKIEAAKTEIDLHIEVLAPHLINELPALILNYQSAQCKSFIENAISRKLSKIIIIHGKGEGILKTEVLHLVKQYKEVTFSIESNNGGALEVWLQY